MLENPQNEPTDLDLSLEIEGVLDPRSKEFRDAIKLTPATLAHFRTRGKWEPAEHLLYISSILAHEIALGDARIIVEIPPRHGKSEEISVHTPTWFLEKFPWASTILTTYAADLSTNFGRRVRDNFLQDETGILSTRLRDDVQRTDRFLTTEGGGMLSVGIGGPITGFGAHLLVVDDYLKNWMEASSETTLKSIKDWFLTTAYTRLEPGGSCVILATRWVLDDLIGWLIANDHDKMWTVIRLPAIAEEDDPLNRQPGEALWPKRYPIEVLRRIERVLGDFMFSAMYQQRPKRIAEAKANVEMIRVLEELPTPHLFRWVRSWDMAATGNEEKSAKKSDWSAGTLIGTNGRPGSSTAQTILADQVRGRWSSGDLETKVLEVAQADGPSVPIVIEQEPGASGKAFAEYLATQILRGYRVEIQPPGGANKWIRAQPYIAAVSHGRIGMLRAAWNEVHKSELKDFPDVKHDDTVDSASQGFNYLHLTKVLVPTWGRTASGLIVPNSGLGQKLITGAVFGRRVTPPRPASRVIH